MFTQQVHMWQAIHGKLIIASSVRVNSSIKCIPMGSYSGYSKYKNRILTTWFLSLFNYRTLLTLYQQLHKGRAVATTAKLRHYMLLTSTLDKPSRLVEDMIMTSGLRIYQSLGPMPLSSETLKLATFWLKITSQNSGHSFNCEHL